MRISMDNLQKHDYTNNDTLNHNPSWVDYVILVALSTILICLTINKGELVGIDTYAHVMTGVFISDYLKDLVFLKGLKYSWNYMWNYYAHYSILGLVHWPPLFHIIESIYFLFVPISEISARLLIYFWAIGGIIVFFKLICRLFDRYTALLASIILVTSPLFLIHARIATLEIPSLTLSLVAIYYFFRYLEIRLLKYCILCAVWSSLAFLTKQTSIFFLVFMLLYFLYVAIKNNKMFANYKHFLWFILIIAVLAGPYYIIAFIYHGSTIMKDVFQGAAFKSPYFTISFYTFYLSSLPEQVSILSIIFLVVFIVLRIFKIKSFSTSSIDFLLLWAISCFILFTFIAQKENRYIIYWTPALAGLAAVTFMNLARMTLIKLQIKNTTIIIYLLILVVSTVDFAYALKTPQPYINGYDSVAKYIIARTPADKKEIIFYDGNDYGQMAFAFRKNDPQKRILIFRSSKFLYAAAMFTKYNLWEIRNSKEDIREFLNQYGIRFIILSYRKPDDPSIDTFRNMIYNDGDFVFLKKFPIISKNRGIPGGELDVYLNKSAVSIDKDKELEIPMPNLNKTIKIKLSIENKKGNNDGV
jgi:hypothetical protein